MRVKSATVGVVSALLVGGMLLGGAPAASAGTNEFREAIAESDPLFEKWLSDGCTDPNYTPDAGYLWHYRTFDLAITEAGDYTYFDIGFDLDVPEYIDIEIGIYQYGQFDPNDPGGPGCIDTLDDDGSFTIPSAGTYTLVLTSNNYLGLGSGTTGLGYWSITGPGMAYLGAAPQSDQTPPPWYQAYARGSSEAVCEEGWKPSYAAWPNDGAGGWTCERELVYNNSTARWDVQ